MRLSTRAILLLSSCAVILAQTANSQEKYWSNLERSSNSRSLPTTGVGPNGRRLGYKGILTPETHRQLKEVICQVKTLLVYQSFSLNLRSPIDGRLSMSPPATKSSLIRVGANKALAGKSICTAQQTRENFFVAGLAGKVATRSALTLAALAMSMGMALWTFY